MHIIWIWGRMPRKTERKRTMGRLIIDGNSVYELDEECIRRKEEKSREKNAQRGRNEKEERKEKRLP